MIELQVIAVEKEGLATEYRLSPDPVIIGAMDSHYAEKLHLSVPAEWSGRTVRVTFTPELCEGIGFVADTEGCVPVTAAFSGAAPRGVITVEVMDAIDVDGETVTRKTFARDVRYRATPHAAPGEPPEDLTPTQFEQFVANVQAAAQDANESAVEAGISAVDAANSASNAGQYADAAANAQSLAQQAQTAAETAAANAVTAQSQAQTAASQATAAQAGAVTERGQAETARKQAESFASAAAESAQKAAESEFAATNAAGTLMGAAEDTANAIVLEASGGVVEIASASRLLKELLVNIDPTLDGRTGTMVTVSADGTETAYTADFGKTVYGGTYNWKTGDLTETWQAFAFDGTEGWGTLGSGTDTMYAVGFKGAALNIAGNNTAMCNQFERGTADGTAGQFWIDGTASTGYTVRFMVDKTVAADITAWKAYLAAQYAAGTPVVMVAEIVEPVVAVLTPTALPRSVAPSCSMAATTGDVSLAYVADTKTYVDENSGDSAADLSDYVKKTDFAHGSNAGVVKTDGNEAYRGVQLVNGVPVLMGALSPLSDSFFANPTVYGVPLLSRDIYRWMKVGITTNANTLTDEEKAAALAWLGANAEIDKSAGVVSFGADGTQTNITWAYNLQGGSIARRLGNGTLWVATPDVDNAAANKAYVDAMGGVFYAEYGVTTFAEITAAIEAGKAVFATYSEMGETWYLPLSIHSQTVVPYGYTFSCTYPAGNPIDDTIYMNVVYVNVSTSDEWLKSSKTIALE